jgi:dTDP-4-dehydrorhamnose reductase
MKKALILGGSGHLGSVFTRRMLKDYQVTSTYHKNLNFVEGCSHKYLDIRNYRDVADIFNLVRPELVINCAALANVEGCEQDTKLAWALNEEGVENIAQYTRKVNAKLVHISTDSVFDGTRGNYNETDETHPINVYGASKLRGEKVAAWAKDYLIIRTAFFGHSGLAKWVIENLKDNKEIPMFRNVYFSPIFTEDLVDIIIKMSEKNLQGLYHVGGRGSWSRYEFGVFLAKALKLNPFLIKRVIVGEVKETAKRPKNLSLDCCKTQTDLGMNMPLLSEGLKRFKESYVKD